MSGLRTFSDWFEITHEGKDIEILASFTFSPFIPATYWQPEEGGEIDIVSVETIAKVDITDQLSAATLGELSEQIELHSDRYDDDGPDPDDERDRRIDAQLTGAGQ